LAGLVFKSFVLDPKFALATPCGYGWFCQLKRSLIRYGKVKLCDHVAQGLIRFPVAPKPDQQIDGYLKQDSGRNPKQQVE
jgi:hypothetical protein